MIRQHRVIAWLIDGLLVLGLINLLGRAGWLAMITYWLLRDGLFAGQSVGKRLMGLQVVMHQGRRPCTFKHSVIRNVLWLLPPINVFMAFAAVYSLLRHGGGARLWGDRLADTQVITIAG